jgi:hypothetical protein
MVSLEEISLNDYHFTRKKGGGRRKGGERRRREEGGREQGGVKDREDKRRERVEGGEDGGSDGEGGTSESMEIFGYSTSEGEAVHFGGGTISSPGGEVELGATGGEETQEGKEEQKEETQEAREEQSWEDL